MHAATDSTTLLLLQLPQCDFRGQPSVTGSSSSFGSPFSIYVNIIPLHLFRVSSVCVSRFTRAVLSNSYFLGHGFVRERRSSPFALQQRHAMHQHMTYTWYNVWRIYQESLNATKSSVIVPHDFNVCFVPKKTGAVLKKVLLSYAIPGTNT